MYLSDRQGLPLAILNPVAGNHNDLYDIEVQFEIVTGTLEQANISVEGLFLNADAGFDSKEFRLCCQKKEINANVYFNKRNGDTDRDEYFDQLLYNERYKIERTNAWMDSFRSLLNRFDTTIDSWLGFNYLAFIIIALKKFNKKKFKRLHKIKGKYLQLYLNEFVSKLNRGCFEEKLFDNPVLTNITGL